jgi:hypothetical protein
VNSEGGFTPSQRTSNPVHTREPGRVSSVPNSSSTNAQNPGRRFTLPNRTTVPSGIPLLKQLFFTRKIREQPTNPPSLHQRIMQIIMVENQIHKDLFWKGEYNLKTDRMGMLHKADMGAVKEGTKASRLLPFMCQAETPSQ